ncbi:MAG: phosphotransferase [Chlorobiaceae bacterium]|nr:phosphotransferase [Chlorobiaceae bacterium]
MDATIRKSILGFFNPEEQMQLAIAPVQGDASTRRYYRIRQPGKSLIACYDPLLQETPGLGSYPFLVLHDIFAAHNLPVPEVIAVDAEKGILLLEDCGTTQLQDIAEEGSNPETVAELYRTVIDTLAQIQSITGNPGDLPFNLAFDREKLMFEFDFFIEHALLDYFTASFDSRAAGLVRSEFEIISAILVQPDRFVLNHRDFHSRNIMVCEGKPVIIDFQDARMGLPQYDAVSLLRDSYVTLDLALVYELKTRHYTALSEIGVAAMSLDEYLYLFDLMAFQRNIKAIGTFCYQSSVLKKKSYDQSIAPTLAYLADYIGGRDELKKVGRLLMPIIEARHNR